MENAVCCADSKVSLKKSITCGEVGVEHWSAEGITIFKLIVPVIQTFSGSRMLHQILRGAHEEIRILPNYSAGGSIIGI